MSKTPKNTHQKVKQAVFRPNHDWIFSPHNPVNGGALKVGTVVHDESDGISGIVIHAHSEYTNVMWRYLDDSFEEHQHETKYLVLATQEQKDDYFTIWIAGAWFRFYQDASGMTFNYKRGDEEPVSLGISSNLFVRMAKHFHIPTMRATAEEMVAPKEKNTTYGTVPGKYDPYRNVFLNCEFIYKRGKQ